MSLHRHLRLCLAAAPFLVSACADDTPGTTGTESETSVDSSTGADGGDDLPNTDSNITLDGTGSSSSGDTPTTLDGSSGSTTDEPGTSSTTDEPGTSSGTTDPTTGGTTDPTTGGTTDPTTGGTTDPTTGGGDSNCCIANGGLGCDDATCEAAVCGADDFCCATEWDDICADEALDLCPVLCDGGTATTTTGADSNCCIANGGIGCDDATCQDSVCAEDPFCCDSQWDTFCASEGLGGCAVCNGGTGDCCSANPGQGGCEDIACVVDICGFDVGIQMQECCDNEWSAACAQEAVGQCTVCAGGTTDPGTTTGNPTTGGDSNCCIANGGTGCDDATCEATVCAADSFCCATEWDDLCAGEAADLCPALCDGGGGVTTGAVSNCCSANGGIGCDDATCEATVCGLDSFCCNVQWDGICAGEAVTNCPALCS